jgi:hypothetical protein
MLAPELKQEVATVVQVEPIEVDGKFFIAVSISGHAMTRQGPYRNIDETEAVAERMRAVARALTSLKWG